MGIKSKKDPSYFTDNKILVRWIEDHHRSGKKPRVSPAAFERENKKGKNTKEEYLSVNCKDLENLSDIINLYRTKNSKFTEPVYTIQHSIKKINSRCNKVKDGLVKYGQF